MIRCAITFKNERALFAYHQALDDCYCNARDDGETSRLDTISDLMGWIVSDNEARITDFPCTLDNMPLAYLTEAVHALDYCRLNEILDQDEVRLSAR